MCGRTACTLAPDDVCQACNFHDKKGTTQKPLWRDPPGGQQYFPSYNVSPGSHTPVLLSSRHYLGELEGLSDRVIQPMMWGMVPSWHKGDPKKVSYETNNCRAEGMLEKRTYKVPLEKGRRCVVLADGFFEWKRDKDEKQPYFIYFPQSSSLCTQKESISDIKQEVKMEDSDWLNVKKEPDLVSNSSDWPVEDKCDQDFKDTRQTLETEKKEIKVEPKDILQNVSLESELFSDFHGHSDGRDAGDKTFQGINLEQGNKCTGKNVPSTKRLLTMAGVFDIWSPPDGAPPLYTYSVITVAASAAMDWLHHRMPAILTSEEEVSEWLDFGDIPLLKAVKNIRPVECIQLHPVSNVVNNSRNKTPDCVEPLDLKKKLKESASSNLMRNWLSRPKNEGVSPVKVSESPPKKKKKTESSVMMGWLNKAKKS
ncbi:abasic site processing protein HMCES-like [Ylistrum balloti]|uniref:abasic site processing protein HMCES-like n=1 Tax=Ylistrum balloti TaxID=509963 RepID=UPI0029059C0B|nr:abasic site processing protein HMCES-like [Ylistrum balloti]